MVRGWACGWLLTAGIALAGAGSAAACVGDCNGDGGISVAELIQGVRISLGDAPLSTCPAFDANADGSLTIDELVLAVAAALGGCPATPTPSPSPTDTASPSPTLADIPTATPTTTPTVPMVSGTWREDPLIVTASSCLDLLTQEFAADLAARPPCDQSIEALRDGAVALVDCTGTGVNGTLDGDGTLRFTYPTTGDTTDGCIVVLTTSLVIPAAASPTTAAYTFAIAFAGTCALDACTIEAQGPWTRQ